MENYIMTTKTKLDEKMQKELSRNILIMAIIFIILGSIGLIGYFIADFLEIKGYEFLLIMTIPLGVGIGFCIIYSNAIQAAKRMNRENIYTFAETFFEIQTLYHNEVEATVKLFYIDIYKVKETKNFLFVFADAKRAYPIAKSNITNIDVLKLMLSKQL